ncbi:MAG: glycosyltransferase family 2 protein [Microcoleaceae cyanobacterium]
MMMQHESEPVILSIILIPSGSSQDFGSTIDLLFQLEASLSYHYEIVILDRELSFAQEPELSQYLGNLGCDFQIITSENHWNLIESLDAVIQNTNGKYIFLLSLPSSEIDQHEIDLDQITNLNILEIIEVRSFNPSTKISDLTIKPVIHQALTPQNLRFGILFYREQWLNNHQNSALQTASPEVILNNIVSQNHPLISVCIPAYNGEKFIREAISSVLTQTYSNIELIISDDNSTDRTVEICQTGLQGSFIPYQIFSHTSYGLAENSNFAMSKAQGRYIKLLFQDDLLDPNCIEEMVKVAELDNEIGLVFAVREMILSNGAADNPDLQGIYQDFQSLHRAWSNLTRIQSGQQLLTDPNLFHHPINKVGEPSVVLLRRDILETVGGFDPKLNQLVDLDLWWRIFANYNVGFVDQTLAYFRLHEQQKTYQNICQGAANDLNFYQKVCQDSEYRFLSSSQRNQACQIYRNG